MIIYYQVLCNLYFMFFSYSFISSFIYKYNSLVNYDVLMKLIMIITCFKLICTFLSHNSLQLNHLVVEALIDKGIPAVGLSVSCKVVLNPSILLCIKTLCQDFCQCVLHSVQSYFFWKII